MVIAIEPMLNEGGGDIVVDQDGWTIRTRDGSRSTHFEHTILITEGAPEILTKI
jgi:methionyl aminopeptidase